MATTIPSTQSIVLAALPLEPSTRARYSSDD